MFLSRFHLAALGAVAFLACGAAANAADQTPTVIHATRHDVSAPMRDIIRTMPPQAPMGTEEEPFLIPNILLKPSLPRVLREPAYPGIQRMPTGVPGPTVDLSFDGINQATSGCGCLPPDTNGDVSDQHYIQWVNSSWAVYDKLTGTQVQGATPGNSFFVGFGGKCETTNAGDPLALWDPQAQRWVMSQFVTSAPYAQCVAVSTSADPLGTYNRYEFNWPFFGDYPKMGVWTDESGKQDAYLLITHEFGGGSAFQGAALIAMERDKMLAGEADAAMVRFGGFDAYGVEPFNLIGNVPAPNGSCPGYVHFDANTSSYLFWDMCLDWTNPGSTVVSPVTAVQGTSFSPFFDSVAQQGTANGLDSFGTHIMYRANVRAFPEDAPYRMSLVVNHTVQGDTQQAGINWVHLALKSSNVAGGDRVFADYFDGVAVPPLPVPAAALDKVIVDQGTFAPDATNRWMGGIAMDGSGNIGVGYSQSDSAMHPQIQVTGRTLDDARGTLRDEQNCTDGVANGSQTSSSGRWGDYSSMSVDPVDQCTFYFTSEYYATTASSAWRTRVCSFKFDGCGDPDFALVSDTPQRIEMCGATNSQDPSWNLRAGVLNGFSGPVTLTATGVPAGAVPNFSANPLQAPGNSTLTLAGGAALGSGEYSLEVDATSGSLTRSVALEFGISEAAPAVPVLVAPANGATGVKVHPTLSWDAVPGALSYTVEVASDAGFANIVASATVDTATWAVDTVLDSETPYFWRVTPHNYCGDGPVSSTFGFTTGVPGECPTGTTASTVFLDDFQAGVNGWTADGTGAAGWTQMAAPAGTGLTTTVWGVPNNATTSDRGLASPAIALPAGVQATILSFDTYHSFEIDGAGCWDNGTMQLKVGAGAFSYLDNSRLFTDPYDGIVSPGEANAGDNGWCHAPSSVPIHSIVDLDGFEGQSVQLRWRAVTDSNTTAPSPNGMYIDNVKVEVCQ